MLPTIATGNVASSLGGGYEVANSCRFNSGDSPYLSRTLGTPTNNKIWTFSTWVKKCDLASNQTLFSANSESDCIRFRGDNSKIQIYFNGTSSGDLETTALYRDPSAWYGIVLAVDTTQSTATNRVKLYVNGTQVTSFSAETYPAEDYTNFINSAIEHRIGMNVKGTTEYFNGYLAETVFIDGLQLGADSFGEFNEDSPNIWQPKDVSGLTFGTNGFYLDYEDSANLGNDANGGTDWSETNLAATDQATDTPTNNFCTLNPLASGVAIGGSAGTFTEGNTRFAGASAAWCSSKSTFSVTNGKWYYEAKKNSDSAGNTVGAGYTGVGYAELQSDLPATNPTNGSGVYSSILFLADNGWTTNFADGTQWGTPQAVDDGDIIGIALNLDDDEYTFYVNGSSVNNGSLGAGYDGNGLTPCIMDYQHARNFYLNFGNPSYANSSDAADANGYGAFEYAPPSGYFALCTKNLAEFG